MCCLDAKDEDDMLFFFSQPQPALINGELIFQHRDLTRCDGPAGLHGRR